MNVIQLTGEFARHEHSRATPMDSVPEPPVELKVDAGAETTASQRVEAGVVTLVVVEAELPQAAAISVARAAVNS